MRFALQCFRLFGVCLLGFVWCSVLLIYGFRVALLILCFVFASLQFVVLIWFVCCVVVWALEFAWGFAIRLGGIGVVVYDVLFCFAVRCLILVCW